MVKMKGMKWKCRFKQKNSPIYRGEFHNVSHVTRTVGRFSDFFLIFEAMRRKMSFLVRFYFEQIYVRDGHR